ncbi:MAG: hypothetical protein Q9191_003906 [Dirinaria sp. TL-2023a]
MPANHRVRLMILFHRKKGMSFQDFDKYWRESHPKVCDSLPIFKKNILKYEQVHVDKESAQSWKDAGHAVTDYDGIVVLEAASEDKIREVFQDPEYLEKLAPDEAKFSERSTFTMFPATMVTVFDTTT